MCLIDLAPGRTRLAVCVLLALSALPAANAQFDLPTHRSIYDAFAYINRIPQAPNEEWKEGPIDLAGRIFGRLANHEGRVLLKLPPRMTEDDYFAFKTFFSFDPGFVYKRAGNCVACHALPDFTDSKTHVVTRHGTSQKTPSLRNLNKSDDKIMAAITEHVAARDKKLSGQVDEIDDSFRLMNITQQDVVGLVRFVQLLNDLPVTDKQFESLIQDARSVDVRGRQND